MDGEKKKVVMIDDEPDLCAIVKANLEGTGQFIVTTTNQPQEAEAICKKEQPDVVLLDHVMPSRKGPDVAKALKSDPETKSIPIIMVSGKGEMVFVKKKNQFQWQPNNPATKNRGEVVESKSPEVLSKAYGVDDYVSKPFTTEVLVEVINEVVKKARKRNNQDSEEQGI